MSRFPAGLIASAITALMSIKWLDSAPCEIPHPGATIPHPSEIALTRREGKEEKEGKGTTNHIGLAPTLEYFRANGSDYTEDEVKRCFSSFEATAINGYWSWGRNQVTDWRSAMETRLSDSRQKHPNKQA